MAQIPIYLKTEDAMPRPAENEYFLLTRDGPFFCRNHPFFASDVPARRPPRALALHEPAIQIRYPRLSVTALEYIIGFFDQVYARHCSEAVVLLFWDLLKKRYRLYVPKQEASVWESYSGVRSPVDVHYTLPMPLPPGQLLVGDIHCHGDIGAYASFTDRFDEKYRDGIHAIVGRIDSEPPEFHLEMAVDSYRFPLKFDQFFHGYHKRRRWIPQCWLDKVSIKVDRPMWVSWTGKTYSGSSRFTPNGRNDDAKA